MIALLKYIRSLELVDFFYFFSKNYNYAVSRKLEKLPTNILFVCTGNICRSAYANKKLSKLFHDPSVSISSAGVDTHDDKPADPKALEIALKRNVNLSSHRTQIATKEKLKAADLILVMDSSHFNKIDLEFQNKVKFLGAFARGKRLTIKDPYGKPDQVFENCFDQIDAALEGLRIELKNHVNLRIGDSKIDTMILD